MCVCVCDYIQQTVSHHWYMHDDTRSSMSQHMIHSISRPQLYSCNVVFNQWYRNVVVHVCSILLCLPAVFIKMIRSNSGSQHYS